MCTHVYSLASHHQILFKCALTYLHAGMDFNDTPFEVTMEAGSGRGLLEVYQGWTDAASAGHLEEVY